MKKKKKKNNNNNKMMKVICANDDKESVMKGVSQGARYYLKKPVWLEEVKNIWHLVAQKNLFNTAKSGTMPAGTDKNPLIPSSKRQRENGNEEEEEQQQQDDERRYRTTHTVRFVVLIKIMIYGIMRLRNAVLGVMCANDDKESLMKGVSHGARDYLKKPVRLDEVKNSLQHVV
ncbi:Two-component response regulator ARR18 [Camellia lanceoleosa]|uniref:Two-component response regulator ARR18 n=1 Tax=Camellia lanceoleosa TaxID=1840588 RepID=A0ACC0FLT5_9ERIC|nr:Two-component response regulator ARR18 [Camellia lanceoleosa]